MSMADRDGLIWFDGKMVEWRDAKLHVLTHSLHYGMAVFEGVRAYQTPAGTAIFRPRTPAGCGRVAGAAGGFAHRPGAAESLRSDGAQVHAPHKR